MTQHRVWLAGAKFGDAAKLPPLQEGLPLILKREPENPYDANAVSVWVTAAALKANGITPPEDRDFKLGMLPAKAGTGNRNWAAVVSPLLERGAIITTTFRRHGNGPTALRIVLDGDDLPPAS